MLIASMGVFSGNTTDIRIDVPNKVSVQSTPLLRVDINTELAPDLYGCQFDLSFDPQALEVVSVKEGDALAQDGASTYWHVSKIDNQLGRIIGAIYVRKGTKKGITASGRLATVIFEVKDVNISKVSRLNLSNVTLVDANTHLIKAVIESASLNWEDLLMPEKSTLLQNYPNPFNPETWIPFKLAQDAPVTINIYDTKGQLVRNIPLGNQNAGVYITRNRAAYWDGKDSLGENVSSGMYFYTLHVGEVIPRIGAGEQYSSTRKMVILK